MILFVCRVGRNYGQRPPNLSKKEKKDLILEMTSREALPGDLIRAESRAGLVNYHRDILDSSIILTKWRELLVRHDGLELLDYRPCQ